MNITNSLSVRHPESTPCSDSRSCTFAQGPTRGRISSTPAPTCKACGRRRRATPTQATSSRRAVAGRPAWESGYVASAHSMSSRGRGTRLNVTPTNAPQAHIYRIQQRSQPPHGGNQPVCPVREETPYNHPESSLRFGPSCSVMRGRRSCSTAPYLTDLSFSSNSSICSGANP